MVTEMFGLTKLALVLVYSDWLRKSKL